MAKKDYAWMIRDMKKTDPWLKKHKGYQRVDLLAWLIDEYSLRQIAAKTKITVNRLHKILGTEYKFK